MMPYPRFQPGILPELCAGFSAYAQRIGSQLLAQTRALSDSERASKHQPPKPLLLIKQRLG
jgi:hypothetical protein